MLGYLALAFAWGAVKARAMGAHRGVRSSPLHRLALAELTEELEFRLGLERTVLPALGLGGGLARFAQAGLFGAVHPGLEVDAALGGLMYSYAWEAAQRVGFLGLGGATAGLAGAFLTHVAHNTGVWAASTEAGGAP